MTASTYRMPCGCSFPVLGPSPFPDDPTPLIDVNVEDPPSCPLVWDMLGKGLTVGVFQLESHLGSHWSKKLQPKSIEHLNALAALLRPGCLDYKDAEGVSMTERYVRRANGEPVPSVHPAVDALLEKTYNVMVFQEDLMRVAGVVAGFDAGKQDSLRKGVGKKQMDVINAVGRDFMDGVRKAGIISPELGQQLWDNIKAAGRYSFNRSHSLSYATISYSTAYAKAHQPVGFYASWLRHAREKNAKWHEEVARLVTEAKLFSIKVNRPRFADLEPYAWTDGHEVHLGLTDAKGVGVGSCVENVSLMREIANRDSQPLAEWPWRKLLWHVGEAFSKADVRRLIEVGAFADEGIPRRRKLAEWDAVGSLNPGELKLAREHARGRDYPPVGELLVSLAKPPAEGGVCKTPGRITALCGKARLLLDPPSPLVDSPVLIANWEKEAFGIPITCHRIDGCDTSNVTHSCIEALIGGGTFQLGVEIKRLSEKITKRGKSAGQPMGFLTVTDGSADLELVVFSEEFAKYRPLLREQNLVLARVRKDAKGGYIAERFSQLI